MSNSRGLNDFDHAIGRIYVDNARTMALSFYRFKACVCQNNNEIAWGAPAGRRPIELHHA